MTCDWTEKISLLIDGELRAEEARKTERHLEACPACRRTREDFLSLRQEIVSYPLAADGAASRRALEQILAGGAAARGAELHPARSRERFSFFKPFMTPAFASAMALVVVGLALGLFWSLGRRDDAPTQVAERIPQDAAREAGGAARGDQTAPGQSTNTSSSGNTSSSDGASPSGDGSREVAAARDPREGEARDVAVASHEPERRVAQARGRVRPVTTLAAGARVESVGLAGGARRDGADALAEFRPLFDAPGHDSLTAPARFEDASAVGEEKETARHFEQAQVLLRSFRNARPTPRNTAIADERRRSQKLLYRNIVLRREAARSGNAPAARALDSLEPILMDIANLPDKPGSDDVRTIQERMEKKNIVAVLQANLAVAPRAYD